MYVVTTPDLGRQTHPPSVSLGKRYHLGALPATAFGYVLKVQKAFYFMTDQTLTRKVTVSRHHL